MQDDIALYLGRRLRARRKALGYTLKALAYETGIPLQQIHKYECAANRMSAGQLWRLATALDIEAAYFYDGLAGHAAAAAAVASEPRVFAQR